MKTKCARWTRCAGVLFLLAMLTHCAQPGNEMPQRLEAVYRAVQTEDFEITGDGSARSWEQAEWLDLSQRASATKDSMETRVKVLYSPTGIYFLFYCEDKKLTAYMDADFMDLWKEDVVEVFLWTDQSVPVYFEYEISPLNYELAIIVSNEDGDLVRWMPFHYEEDRQTRHATAVLDGEKRSDAAVSGWTAEFFIPYKLLRPLNNIAPRSGTEWRANFYRVDYDDDSHTSWAWQQTTGSFHQYERFGTLVFD